ncbi:MAG: DNA polymerase III subunit gamma/tau [Chitinophagaceae bacterium]
MDKFIVSARKYRPQNFSTVVGQEHITTTLKNAIRNNQLAHAFLFCGPRGVGKTTCARILAKTINCENLTKSGEACNECHSCVSFNEGTSLSIHELDAASNNSVDDIRSLVEQVRIAPPQTGKYKVYIIDEVHMLTTAAFNAFLKTLEEPPSYAIFILATTEKHKILPTILSRCQIFDFKRITTNDTVSHLLEICEKEEIIAEKPALHLIAQKSEGCMRDALSILDKIVSLTNGKLTYQNSLEHLNILDADYYFKMLACMQAQDLAGALLLYDDIDRKGFEGDIVINGFIEFLRNLLICQDTKVASLLEVVETFKKRYHEEAAKVSISYIISSLNILNEFEINYRSARNKKLHVELCLIKLCYLKQALELSSNDTGVGKKKQVDGLKPLAFRILAPMEVREGKNPAVPPDDEEPKLIIEALPVVEQKKINGPEPVVAAPTRITALNKIRKQYSNANENAVQQLPVVLETEELSKSWSAFSRQLKDAKNPAYQSFERASLRLINDNNFEVVCGNNLELKFIDQQRISLYEHLQSWFNNKSVSYNIKIDEQVVNESYTEDIPLNSRQQFQKMIEQYPLVQELKDRLRLELDY